MGGAAEGRSEVSVVHGCLCVYQGLKMVRLSVLRWFAQAEFGAEFGANYAGTKTSLAID